MAKNDKDKDVEWVYTKTIRLRNGKILRASEYGLKAFRFPKPQKKKAA